MGTPGGSATASNSPPCGWPKNATSRTSGSCGKPSAGASTPGAAFLTRLLLAAGVSITKEYVKSSDHPQRDNLLDHLGKMSQVTDEEVAQTLSQRRRYYGEILDEVRGE